MCRSHSNLPVTVGSLQGSWRGTLIRNCSDSTRDNGFKWKEEKFRLDIKKKFFTVKVVRHWERLPRDVVDSPSLAAFKTLSSLV